MYMTEKESHNIDVAKSFAIRALREERNELQAAFDKLLAGDSKEEVLDFIEAICPHVYAKKFLPQEPIEKRWDFVANRELPLSVLYIVWRNETDEELGSFIFDMLRVRILEPSNRYNQIDLGTLKNSSYYWFND